MQLKEVKVKEVILDKGTLENGEPWEATSIVVETQGERYPDTACVRVAKKVCDELSAAGTPVSMGDVVDLDIDITIRGYVSKDGRQRYSNSLYAWAVKHSEF